MKYLSVVLLLCLIFSCNKEHVNFTQIKFESSYCEGECPVYTLDIHKDGTVIYNSIDFNKEEKGYYTGYLDAGMQKKLKEYFNQTNVENLKSEYEEALIADHPCYRFIFYLENGNEVQTNDCSASYNVELLKELYPIIIKIKENTQWVRKMDK